MTDKIETNYAVIAASCKTHATYELAEAAAKKAAGQSKYNGNFEDYSIYQRVAVARQPVADIEVIKVG